MYTVTLCDILVLLIVVSYTTLSASHPIKYCIFVIYRFTRCTLTNGQNLSFCCTFISSHSKMHSPIYIVYSTYVCLVSARINLYTLNTRCRASCSSTKTHVWCAILYIYGTVDMCLYMQRGCDWIESVLCCGCRCVCVFYWGNDNTTQWVDRYCTTQYTICDWRFLKTRVRDVSSEE